MITRLIALRYAVFAYAVFVLTMVYLVGFLSDVVVPRAIDTGPVEALPPSVLIDVGLVTLFCVPHSVMARPSFKRLWRRFLPREAQRSTYVLVSSLLLLLLFWQWRALPQQVWALDGVSAVALWLLFGTGWAIAVGATWMIDHFELFGLREALDAALMARRRRTTLVTPALYAVVRHPIMLGFLLAFWATPHMTLGHLVFAATMTAYVALALPFEERDLEGEFGAAYIDYRKRVPALLPRPWRQ